MKIAIVHDDFIQKGGAEELVIAMLELFPNSTLFTTYITEEWRQKIENEFPDVEIKTTFMQKLPKVHKYYKFYALLFPIAIESMDFNNYNLVLSSSARYAHGVLTKPETTHIAYVNSPARMLWNEYDYFGKSFKHIRRLPLFILRIWDQVASNRPDFIIANSTSVSQKITKYWRRKSVIIHPFCDINTNNDTAEGSYYLVVSRLEKWKNIEIAIKACERLKRKLLIVGEGKDFARLKKMSNLKYIKFTKRVSKEKLKDIYLNSKALIMTQNEDFGITSIEAQSFGKPVIAYGAGGAFDTIKNGKTGLFFKKQTVDDLVLAISIFEKMTFDPKQCILNAQRFSREKFKSSLIDFINKNVKYT